MDVDDDPKGDGPTDVDGPKVMVVDNNRNDGGTKGDGPKHDGPKDDGPKGEVAINATAEARFLVWASELAEPIGEELAELRSLVSQAVSGGAGVGV